MTRATSVIASELKLVECKRGDVPDARQGKHGLTIADVLVSNGTNVNQKILRDDWCWCYRKYTPGDMVLEGPESNAREMRKSL